jgi:hypothetical protein
LSTISPSFSFFFVESPVNSPPFCRVQRQLLETHTEQVVAKA